MSTHPPIPGIHRFIYLQQLPRVFDAAAGLVETGLWECTKCGKRNPKNTEWYDVCIPDQASITEHLPDAEPYVRLRYLAPTQLQTESRTPECAPTDSGTSRDGAETPRSGAPTAPARSNRFPTNQVAGNIKAPPPVTPVTGGVKLDQGKARWDLLPCDALDAVAEVLTFGANKYAARNWELGMDWGRLQGALMRHVSAWAQGRDIDEESGKRHLAHAATCALMLLALTQRGDGTDDRGAPCST